MVRMRRLITEKMAKITKITKLNELNVIKEGCPT